MPSRSSMDPKFPFTDFLADSLQRYAVALICDPRFPFALPELSDTAWATVCANPIERERLEFRGDALIGVWVSEAVCRLHPKESPGFYTCVKQVLTCNATFAHIMHRCGRHDINGPVKPAGDAFETILAAFHDEKGAASFHAYLGQYFMPLVEQVASKYHQNRAKSQILRRKKRGDLHRSENPLIRTKRSLRRNKIDKKPLSLVKDSSPYRRYNPCSSSSKRLFTVGPSTSQAKKPVTIDLTGDDSEDEVVITIPMQRVSDKVTLSLSSHKSQNTTLDRPSASNIVTPSQRPVLSSAPTNQLSIPQRSTHEDHLPKAPVAQPAHSKNLKLSNRRSYFERTRISTPGTGLSADSPIVID